jgi:hypothetical protein
MRVTPQGFTKLTSLVSATLNSQLAPGFCVGSNSFGFSVPFVGFTGVDICNTNNGGCNPGCKANVGVNPNGVSLSVTNAQQLDVGLSLNIDTTIHIDGQIAGSSVGSCNLHVTSTDFGGDFDIAFGIKPTNGELDIHLASINTFHLNMDFSNCGFVSDVANLVSGLVDSIEGSFLGPFVNSILSPILDGLVQSFIPNPLGIAGTLDVANLLGGISPGTKGEMEARVVPGGYVSLVGNGMSLGVITGVNSDMDTTTRTGTRADGVPLASEPSLCVPPLGTPDFSAAPFSLPTTTRGTFRMDAADEFNGSPDPTGTDLVMGISHTTLDQLGHHLVTSGGMCLGVGTTFINQLTVGTVGILVPSLADLDDTGKAPLLLVTRPQREITFAIGDNNCTADPCAAGTSPALTISLSHMEVDFYAFLYERYVRAFTLDLTMNIGVNLDFQQMPGMPAQIVPTLEGISSSEVTLTVLNSEFVKESAAHLEMVLPSVFDLVTPLLNLPPITVPSFAGFSLNNLSITKVTTSQDEFLALYANLGASAMMRQLGETQPFAREAIARMDADIPPAQARSTGGARFVGVTTPAPEVIIAGLSRAKNGALPTITFDADRYDAGGRELEWNWNFNGGMWHEWRPGGTLAISDRAFAWQGHFAIGLKSRVKGDYHTVSETQTQLVTVDSVGPKILTKQAHWTDSDRLVIPVADVVDGTNVKIAYGKPGESEPQTGWVAYDADLGLSRADADKLTVDGLVAVYAEDQTGNRTIELVAPFHGQAGGTGCTCNTGAPGAGGIAMILIVGFVVLRRRDRRWLRKLIKSRAFASGMLWVGASVLTSMTPGCDCKNNARSCETADDCGKDSCPKGQLPFCIDNTCVCSDDIPPGRIGPYSSVAASPDQSIWVSAYAETYGDLVVAQTQGGRIPDESWQWVDGVPLDANVDVPGSMIRGGISTNGPDVGMYTSIAVEPDGTPVVTYFDVDNASLKFAAMVNGAWQMHTIDAGAAGSKEVGMYTSISLRADDGRPGVAYLAHVTDGAGTHAEVRYASAQVAVPQSAADWQFWTVDTADLPPPDPNNPDVYPLPGGLGLWIASTRDPRDQTPVVVYYDRAAGELKIARFTAASGQFQTPKIHDGSKGNDAGWTPSVRVDGQGVAHVAYINATTDSLMYVTDAAGAKPIVADNGYRIVGQTVDGLPKPEFHILDNADIVLPAGNPPLISYQDGTTQELLLAQQQTDGTWTHVSVAGATDPWPGAYGFFAAAAVRPSDVVLSTWVIDQPTDENWVEVFTKPTLIQ